METSTQNYQQMEEETNNKTIFVDVSYKFNMFEISLNTNGSLVTTHSHNNEMKCMDATPFINYNISKKCIKD